MFWNIILFVVSSLVSILLAPKPQNAKAAGLDEFSAPTAEAGREIPVLFGTRLIKGANVVWYGDLEAVPIKKKGGKK